jgi:2-dehydro-3-deoxygluconokinase
VHGCDVVTLGETMAALIDDRSVEPAEPGPAIARGDTPYPVRVVGAESNVAVGLAQLGCTARWVSRLGDDRLGHLVRDTVAAYGVDVQVTWDAVRTTGLCVKEIGPDSTRVRYYRSQSAARQLGVADLARLGPARWVHVSGVTAAISPSAADALSRLVSARTSNTRRVSFDVNYRPVLWPSVQTAARTLVDLARQADLVFIGDDEAQALLGTSETGALADRLVTRWSQQLVIKRGAGPATVLTGGIEVTEPARPALVMDVTGAGDAFAAGYLAGACWEWEPGDRLRLGHFLAARVVGVPGDIGPAVTDEDLVGVSSRPRAVVPTDLMDGTA